MKRLTEEEVTEELVHIAGERYDDECAHSDEDDLHKDVLASIAQHSSDDWARGLARAALKTLDIKFSRWCA